MRANLLHEPVVAAEAAQQPAAAAASAGAASAASPSSPNTPSADWSESEGAKWFSQFDDTHNGKLTRDQLLRALVKSVPHVTLQVADDVVEQLGENLPELRRVRGRFQGEVITLEQFLTARVYVMIANVVPPPP